MSLNLVILCTFNLLIISYVTFLIQQAIAYKSKFGYLCEASGLGEIKNAQHKIYNLGYFLFGFLNLWFTYNLSLALSPSPMTSVAITLKYITDVSLCLIAFFPRDTFHFAHVLASIVMFFCTISSLILFSYPFYQSPIIPKAIIPFNFIIVTLLVNYLYLKVKNFRIYGKLDNNMEKQVSIWEWIPFISGHIWIFVLNNVLIFQILK